MTYDQYKNVTLSDILFADIIVVSYNFLLNKNYIKKFEIKKDINIVLKEFEHLSPLKLLNTCNSELNLFENFYFKNICLDESHEIKSGTLYKKIKLLNSRYVWNITATPFADGISSFINNISFITNLETEIRIDENIIDTLSILYRRNTRDSVKNEFGGNIISESLKLLEFTEQERRIYDAHNIINGSKVQFLIKLCCDTSIDCETGNLVKNCKTLDEIESVILNFNRKKLVLIKKKINSNQLALDELLLIIDRGYSIRDEVTIEEAKIAISIYKRKITIEKKEYDNINRTYTYLKNAIDNIKDEEICPICLDNIEVDSIAITKCGHKFCNECIYEYIDIHKNNSNIKCPKCNIYITISEIYLLQEEIIKVENHIKPELNELIQRLKSTKIGNIIYYIKNQMKKEDKCIIFSQWDSILKKIGHILENENLHVVYCSGTVYQRKHAIKDFQENTNCNIICLSSENCASGINLTSANKIIFIEPIYGEYRYRKDIENQGSARSDRLGQKRPIEIIKFIIKDTIEEQVYNENKLEDKRIL